VKKALYLSILFTFSSFAETTCSNQEIVAPNIDQWVAQMNRVNSINCADLSRPLKHDDAKQLLKTLAAKQKLSLGSNPEDLNRHVVGQKLNNCEASATQKALVINFEGTGSFSPRTTHLMKQFSDCVGDGDLGKNFHYHAMQAIKKTYGDDEKWSALSAGPLNQLASAGKTKALNWVSFASEETEILGDPGSLSSYTPTGSTIYPRGVVLALSCLKAYRDSAKQKGITPKIIVQSHSSGARSAVKFLEVLKAYTPPQSVDLMLTIDPVKEAHLAVDEVLAQIAGNANRAVYNSLPFVDDVEIKPPNVWTRRQPNTLYKPSNTSRAVNVYQNVDTEGLKSSIKFGIHGSPIHNADINLFIKDGLGGDAHGEITRHDKTKELIKKEYQRLGLLP
tara:strand:+ start:4411 stop:5586 length:1176 start_codon:yes stop_codon:yes gene_type:complete